jgi:hypothetical protein
VDRAELELALVDAYLAGYAAAVDHMRGILAQRKRSDRYRAWTRVLRGVWGG